MRHKKNDKINNSVVKFGLLENGRRLSEGRGQAHQYDGSYPPVHARYSCIFPNSMRVWRKCSYMFSLVFIFCM